MKSWFRLLAFLTLVYLSLSHSVEPLSYDLRIQIKDFTYTGKVGIDVRCLKDTDMLTMDTVGMNVIRVQFEFLREYLVDRNFTTDGFFLYINNKMKKDDTLRINIEFEGKMEQNLVGFYRTQYVHGNDSRWLLATQFAPKMASRAFPCIDSPYYRVPFNVSLQLDDGLRFLPDKVDFGNSGRPISVQSLGWVVYDPASFESLNSTVWARSEVVEDAQLAVSSVRSQEERLAYYLPPQLHTFLSTSLVALPDYQPYLPASYGLAIARESDLLYKEGVSSIESRKRVFMKTAEALTGQLFQTVVSPKQMSVTWLTTGLTRFFQYAIANEVSPKWRFEEDFFTNEIDLAMEMDSLMSTPSLIMPNLSETDLPVFAPILYSKGAAVVRMLTYSHGMEAGEKIMSLVLNAVINASGYITDDAAWGGDNNSSTSPPTIEAVMRNWAVMPGYPVVYVTKRNNTLYIYQRNSKKENETGNWWIPLTFTNQTEMDFSGSSTKIWLKPREEITIELKNSSEWILFNPYRTGFYRVNYDDELWESLRSVLGDLPDSAKGALVGEALSLARTGHLPYDTALSLASALKNETSPLSWSAPLRHFGAIRRSLSNQELPFWKSYVLDAMDNVLKNISFLGDEGEDPTRKLLRINLWREACDCGHEECLANAKNLVLRLIASPNNISESPDMRTALLCAGVRQANANEWEAIFEISKQAHPSERSMMLQALGCIEDQVIIKRFLKEAFLALGGLKRQDKNDIIKSICSSPEGANTALDFFTDNPRIARSLSSSEATTVVSSIFSEIGTIRLLNEVKGTISKLEMDVSKEVMDVITENRAQVIEQRTRSRERVARWLNPQASASATSIPSLALSHICFVYISYITLVSTSHTL